MRKNHLHKKLVSCNNQRPSTVKKKNLNISTPQGVKEMYGIIRNPLRPVSKLLYERVMVHNYVVVIIILMARNVRVFRTLVSLFLHVDLLQYLGGLFSERM